MIPSQTAPMAGRVCVVTGGNSGIGKATALGLAAMGATVVLACRDRRRAEAAREEIRGATGNANLEVMELDLARQSSVRAFASTFLALHSRLHVLVNNAGIYSSRRTLTPDGIESTFAIDYLSHFLLTRLLLDALSASAPSRIVNVTSNAHQLGWIDFEGLRGDQRWRGWRAYAQAKLAQVLFTKELARRLGSAQVTVNCAHPGGVRTNFARGSPPMRIGFYLAWPFLISPTAGADTIVYLASSGAVDGVTGGYFIKRRPATPNRLANDPEVARRLWEVSEALTAPRPAGR